MGTANRDANVNLRLNKRQFISDARTIEEAMNGTWKRVAAGSSVIGKKLHENAAKAVSSIKSALSTDELGRGPFMKLLGSLERLKVASFDAMKRNASTLKAMFTADEIGRTPFMRLRDMAQKLKTTTVASVKDNAASMKQALRPDALIAFAKNTVASAKRGGAAFRSFMSTDDVGRGPIMKMIDGMHRLENKSVTAFRRIGEAAKGAFGKSREWASALGDSLSKSARSFSEKMGGAGRGAKNWLGGLFRKSVGDEPGQHGALTAGAIAGAGAVKDIIMGGVSSAVSMGMGLLSEAGNNSEKAAQISVSARSAGGKYIDPKILEAESYAVTQQVKGTTAEGALDAMAQFLTLTGDLDTARKSVATFATVARATGANLSDVSASTAAISQQFKITDPEQIKEVLASLAYQGKAGAIELSDLATGLQSLAAGGASFGLSGVQGVKTLGGITQIAKQGSGSAAETFTAVQGLFREMTAKADKLEGKGVKVYEGKGANKHTRDPTAILTDAIAKLGGNDVAKKASELQSIFNDSLKAIKPLMSTYDLTYRNTQGSEKEKVAAATAEVKKAFDNAINAAGAWEDVVSDAAKMQNTNSAKLTAVMEKFKGQIGETILPEVTKFVDALSKSPTAIEGFTTAIIATGETLSKLNRLFGIEEPSTISAADTEKKLERDAERLRIDKLHAEGKLTAEEEAQAQSLADQGFMLGNKSKLQSAPAETIDPLWALENQSKLETGLGGALRSGDMKAGASAVQSFYGEQDTSMSPMAEKRKQQKEAISFADNIRAQQLSDFGKSGAVPMQLRLGSVTGGNQATPAPAKTGPVKIDGVAQVAIVRDDTTRGAIPSPTPGPVSRL